MTHHSLTDLGWSDHFAAQIADLPAPLHPARLTSVARTRIAALTPDGPLPLLAPAHTPTGAFAVGDWVLFDPDDHRITRLLDPATDLTRRAAGHDQSTQRIAANVDTLGIVTSCNADFNVARLERYLALAASAGCLPLVILTKADQAADPGGFVRQAQALSPLVTALPLNARDADDAARLAPWCDAGQTLALVGSSGVGKSTLLNALSHHSVATQAIREDDAKGRHTTTARGLYATRHGGWLIDTPGIRELALHDAADGIDSVFSDLSALAAQCRFSDCAHDTEPGCAIRAALESGQIDQARVDRWQKLLHEDALTREAAHETRARQRAFSKHVKQVMRAKKPKKR